MDRGDLCALLLVVQGSSAALPFARSQLDPRDGLGGGNMLPRRARYQPSYLLTAQAYDAAVLLRPDEAAAL
jgi:hypothetical protein